MHLQVPSLAILILATVSLTSGACTRDEENVATEPLTVRVDADGTVVLSQSPGLPASNQFVPAPDLSIHGLPHPLDVGGLGRGSLTVLDRADSRVVILDEAGRTVRTLGRAGDGPGEFRDPISMATSGDGQRIAVWDRTGRLTVLRVDGSVVATSSEFSGDAMALGHGQRLGVTLWEEPFQLTREDYSRRLVRWGERGFALGLQPDERFALTGEDPQAIRLAHTVLLFDSLPAPPDTAVVLPAAEIAREVAASDLSAGRSPNDEVSYEDSRLGRSDGRSPDRRVERVQ